jgi:hypothetical protein
MIRMNLIVKDRVELMIKILVIKDTMDVMITVGIVVKDIGRHDGEVKHVGKWYGWV